MNQLGELKKNADKFKAANTEVIAVFREEAKGEEGLKIIQENKQTPFTLALDLNKEKTARYSTKRGEFTGYVINPEGTITEIIEGNLRKRANSEQLLKAVAAASKGGSSAKGSAKKGSEKKGSKSKGSAPKSD